MSKSLRIRTSEHGFQIRGRKSHDTFSITVFDSAPNLVYTASGILHGNTEIHN